MMTKPNNLFDKGELDTKYKVFKQKTQSILEEEEMKRERDEAIGIKQPKSKLENADTDQTRTNGANVSIAINTHQLTVGKPKKQIVQSLDQKEKDVLRSMIQEESDRFDEKMTKKYHEKFNCNQNLS